LSSVRLSDSFRIVATPRESLWRVATRRESLWSVAARFDVVTIGIEDERAVVVLVILGTEPGRSVVLPASGNGCVIKFVDLFAVVRTEGDVKFGVRSSAGHPKVGFRWNAIADDNNAIGVFTRHFHEFFVTKRRESFFVKAPALLGIADVKAGMVNHSIAFF